MRYVEQILKGKQLNITQVDVPYLQLHYVAHVLIDDIRHKGGPSITKADGIEDGATKDDNKDDRAD